MASKLELLATHLGMGQKATSQLVRDLHARTGTVWSHEALYMLLLPHPGPFPLDRVLALVTEHTEVTALSEQLALAPESIPIMLERLRTKLGFPVPRGEVVAACALLGETARDQNELRAFFRLVYGATKTQDARSVFATTIQALRSTLSPSPSYQEMAAVWHALPSDRTSPRMEHFKDYLLVDAAVRQAGIAGGGVRYLERVWLPQARDLTLDELAAIVARHHTLDQPGIQAVIRVTRFAKKNATSLEELLATARRSFRRPGMVVRDLGAMLDVLAGSWETIDDLVAYGDLLRMLQNAQVDLETAPRLVKSITSQLPSHRSLAALGAHVATALSTLPPDRRRDLPLLIKATLAAIHTEDLLSQIARCLGADLAATREIVARIQRAMEPPMSLRHIATFIAALPAHQQTDAHVLQYFDDYATETALAAQLTTAERDRIAAAMRTSTRQRIESIDILRAVKHVLDSPKAERVDEAIAYLHIQHQGHTVTHPEVLRASLRKQLARGTFRDVSRHLELLPVQESRGRSIEGLYAERCLALCLCQALPLTLAESQALIRQIRDISNVILPRLLEIINQLPAAERDGETLLAYLTIESWLAHQDRKGYTPARLRSDLAPGQPGTLGYPAIARMLLQLPAASLSVSDLAPYARLAAWMADPAATRSAINRQLPNAITYHAMVDFWQHTPAPAMTTPDDAIALFRLLPSALREQPWVQRTDAEIWATTHAIAALVGPRWRSLSAAGLAAARQAVRQDWRAITSEERLYAIPARGYAEIQVDPDVLRRTGITALRFIQEHSAAPAVRIRVTLGDPQHALVAWIALDRDGETTGFHQQLGDPSYAAFVHTMAVAYYRDLVVPIAPALSIPEPWPMQQRARPMSPGPTRTRHPEPSARTLPRQRTEGRHRADLTEWHHAQERARHDVVGHARKVDPGFRADPEKVREAAQAGVHLMAGYTWVRPHERGSVQHYGRITLDGDVLVYPMLFTPPARATRLLQSLV